MAVLLSMWCLRERLSGKAGGCTCTDSWKQPRAVLPSPQEGAVPRGCGAEAGVGVNDSCPLSSPVDHTGLPLWGLKGRIFKPQRGWGRGSQRRGGRLGVLLCLGFRNRERVPWNLVGICVNKRKISKSPSRAPDSAGCSGSRYDSKASRRQPGI